VGDSGLILKSTNSGTNWITQTSGVTRKLTSIYSITTLQAVAVGEKGTILRTTNAGTNWQNISLADTTINLNKVGYKGSLPFGIIAGIVGDNGSLFQSTDFVLWNPVQTGTTRNLRDFFFTGNGSTGFLTGDSGTVLYTTNAGLNWTSDFFLQSLTEERINAAIRISDSTFAGIAGNEFIIFSGNEPILPVELASFNSVVKNNVVTLLWMTMQEVNNYGFDVERSSASGGVKSQTTNEWSKIGFISGNGTSSSLNNYEYTDRNLVSGKYKYRLKQNDFNSNFKIYNLTNEVTIGIPQVFSLSQNYPNPFNPSTTIDYNLPVDGKVSLKVYDLLGREVEVLVNEFVNAGYYSVSFNKDNAFAGGVYFYRLHSQSFTDTKRMILVK